MKLEFHTYETKLSSQRLPKATLTDLPLGQASLVAQSQNISYLC